MSPSYKPEGMEEIAVQRWTRWDAKAIEEAVRIIYRKSMVDEEFRQLCFTEPKKAVWQATGMNLPDHFKLRFVDNAGAHLTLVLPDMITNDELSDEDLEAVAGGVSVLTPPTPYLAELLTVNKPK